jgi:uncharacterized membrane protein
MSEDPESEPSMGDLVSELHELANLVDDPEEREQVREAIEMARDVDQPGVFGRVIRGYDRADAAEAFLGSLLLGIPMFVEGGTAEVGETLVATPPLLGATFLGTLATVYGIVFVADIQDVQVTDPLLGFIPRRLVGVIGISHLTAAAVMTAWGRIAWSEPVLALAQVVVAAVPMAIGAALSDLLPGT